MKKVLLICAVMFGVCFSVFADAAGDAQFRQYVEVTKASPTNPDGMTVAADYKYRIIYCAMPLPVSSSDITDDVLEAMKNEMMKAMRASDFREDRRVIRELGINFVYTFITTDKRIITIGISYKDI